MTNRWDWRSKSINWRNLSTWDRENYLHQARLMRAECPPRTWDYIEGALNISYDTIRRRLDPEYAERLVIRLRAKNLKANRPADVGPAGTGLTREEAAAALKTVPLDTRTPAQQLLGDPIFERSALGRRAA